MWYSFTASTSSLVLNFIQNNSTNLAPDYVVYGPYTTLTAGCTNVTSACTGGSVLATAQPTSHVSGPVGGVSYNLINGDPGKYTELTGLTTTAGNNTYLIQVQNNNGGGGNDRWVEFCVGVHAPAANAVAPAANLINQCGITFNGSTGGGNFPSATGAGFNNLDNAATQCGSCAGGADVTYVINNPSWFTFCAATAGTYNVQFDVTSCVNSAFTGATGGQMALLTGTTNSLTNVWQATSPTLVSTAVQTSPNFALAAGKCAYLVVDGFAGDACNYSYILTNVAGGCILLPVELMSFDAVVKNDAVEISWMTASEKNNSFFSVERSKNGIDFETFKTIQGAENSTVQRNYFVVDKNAFFGLSYYRLKQTDANGKYSYSEIKSVNFAHDTKFQMSVFPNPIHENNSLFVSISSDKNDKVVLSITDMSGKIVAEKEVKFENSNTNVEVKHNFEPGIYFVKVVNHEGQAVYQKLIVR
jgi:hypothetical protein